MAGQDEAVDARLARVEQRPQRAGHRLVQAQDGEVGQAALAGQQQRAGHGRRRGLEADADEHELALGLGGGQVDGVDRRVDDAHVGPGGALAGQAAA